MRKIIPFLIVGILILSGFGAVALNNDNEILENKTVNYEEEDDMGRDFTHTVLGEYCTATWCGYCKYAHAALKNIYAGDWFPFYYVSLVTDKNTHAMARRNEITSTGYPTVVWDGGYKTDVGAGSTPAAQAAYNSSINQCGNRAVNDIDITLDVTWLGPGNPSPEDSATGEEIDICLSWTNAEMNIDVTVDNNEGSSYSGHLHTYVTEVVSSMGWYDTGGYLYTFPFLDYAFNQDISISSYGSWQNDIDWDGKDYNTGHGEDFGEITQDNIMVIAAVFDESNDYVDETAGLLAGTDTDPKTFDVYFGDTNPPPKVSSGQSDLEYCPDDLDFDTTYYWKIVVWDDQGNSITGPIWSFTTRGNVPPNTPSDPDPGDGETGVYINAVLSWTGGDPDGDDVTYDVYFGTSNPPPLVEENQPDTSYDPPGILDFDTTYYWKIVAWDVFDYSAAGPIWSFTTEGNVPPNTPSNPDPEDGATDVSINEILRWDGGDPNSGDTVTYDVYFGTSSPPPLEAEGIMQDAYDPSTMNIETKYYWQIVAEDSMGLTSTGPIWSFTTEKEPNEPPEAPIIYGPPAGSPGKELYFVFTSFDFDGDQLKYIIDWGDGDTFVTNYYPEGEAVEASHTYEEIGAYTIIIKAEDEKGVQSEESEFDLVIEKTRTIFNKLFSRLFELFPILERLLYLFRLS